MAHVCIELDPRPNLKALALPSWKPPFHSRRKGVFWPKWCSTCWLPHCHFGSSPPSEGCRAAPALSPRGPGHAPPHPDCGCVHQAALAPSHLATPATRPRVPHRHRGTADRTAAWHRTGGGRARVARQGVRARRVPATAPLAAPPPRRPVGRVLVQRGEQRGWLDGCSRLSRDHSLNSPTFLGPSRLVPAWARRRVLGLLLQLLMKLQMFLLLRLRMERSRLRPNVFVVELSLRRWTSRLSS